jgi:lipopolysaccharide/colanic/teichoic acid biosynthesis glycosyltransferase
VSTISPGRTYRAQRQHDLLERNRTAGVIPRQARRPSSSYRVAKRALDLLGASALLTVFAPVWAIVAVAIKLDSPGPALFSQERVGRFGRPFILYKFRSMRAGSDDAVHRAYVEALIRTGAASEALGGNQYYKLRRDPRVTRVGRLLRKTSLDEIPQLVNILRGEMSLVGPRPPLPYEVDKYEPWQLGRLRTLPGLTGMWQVYGRSRVTFEDMVRMDIQYIEQASIWLDLRLLFLTIPAVLSGAGAD